MSDFPRWFPIISSASLIAFNLAYPRVMARLIKRKTAAFERSKGIEPGAPFSVGTKRKGTLRVEKVKLTSIQNAFEIWLDIKLDQEEPPFPFEIDNTLPGCNFKDLRDGPSDAFRTLKRHLSLRGEEGTFWALMDRPTRRWLFKYKPEITKDRVSLKIYDTNDFGWGRLRNPAKVVEQAVHQLEAWQQDLKKDLSVELANLLATEKNTGVRRTALAAWVGQNPPADKPAAAFAEHEAVTHLEFWLFVLYQGGVVPESVKARFWKTGNRELRDLIFQIFYRQPESKRLGLGVEALASPLLRRRIFAVLVDQDRDGLVTALTEAYQHRPESFLLDNMVKIDNTRIVRFLCETFDTLPRSFLLTGARYLARNGDRDVLAPLITAGKRVPLGSRAAYHQAVDQLRLRLGVTKEHAGAVSLPQTEVMQGALDIPHESGTLSLEKEAASQPPDPSG